MRELVLTRLNQFILPATHLLGLLLNLVLLFVFFYYHDHGFDLTDEAFYALSATQHDNIIIGMSFGYLTSYLISLFSCDFHDTRIIGFILLLGSTILMSSSCLYKYTGRLSFNKLLTAVSISTPCIIFYSHGIYSLSYNSYSVFGINFILTGLFFNKNSKIFSLPSLFVGLGIFLIGMSKFTIIPVFIFFTLVVYFLCKDKSDLKMLLNGSVISLFFLLVHFFISNDSGELFFKRLMLTYENISLLNSSHIEQFSLFFLLSKLKEYIFQIDVIVLFIYSICPIFFFIFIKNKNSIVHLFFTILVISLISYPLFNSLKRWVWYIDYTFLFYFTQFILVCVFVKLTNNNLKKFNKLLCLLFAPFIYAVGSNNGLSFGGYLTLFWPLIAIFVIFLNTNKFKTVNFSLLFCLTILLTLISAFHGFKHPYRIHGRISQQSSTLNTLDGKHEMVVEQGLSKFINILQQQARIHGLEKNTPMINLTNNPGFTFLLSSKIVSTPWLFGGYSGSIPWTSKMLEIYEEDDLKLSWILTSENNPLGIPTNVLRDSNIDFPQNFLKIPISSYNDIRYFLWKPLSYL